MHLQLFQKDAAKFLGWSSVITSYSSLTQETACCILLLVFHYVLYYGCEPEYWKAPLSDNVTAIVPSTVYQEYNPSISLEAYEMYYSLKMANLPTVLTEARRKLNPKSKNSFEMSTLSNQELLALQCLLTVSQQSCYNSSSPPKC